jgi:hypothetical protein
MMRQMVMCMAHLATAPILIMCLGVGHPAAAGPIAMPHSHQTDAERAVHDAEHMVDEAWEVYHEAALGGTLASPALQAQIERDLHDARNLLVEAREAADRGSREELNRILARIKELSTRAIQASREKKK